MNFSFNYLIKYIHGTSMKTRFLLIAWSTFPLIIVASTPPFKKQKVQNHFSCSEQMAPFTATYESTKTHPEETMGTVGQDCKKRAAQDSASFLISPCKKKCTCAQQETPTDLLHKTIRNKYFLDQLFPFLSNSDYKTLSQTDKTIRKTLKKAKSKWLARKLIEDIYNPMGYVLREAKGNQTVTVYGQAIHTHRLLKELTRQGERITQVDDLDQQHLSHEADIVRAKGAQAYLLPDTFNISKNLTYDVCTWLLVDVQDVDTLEHQIKELLKQHAYPCAIALSFQYDTISKKLLSELQKYPIVSLSFSDCEIENIHELANFRELRELYINQCEEQEVIEEWPSSLCHFPHLQTLVLHHTNIKTLSKDIGNLSQLKFLYIGTSNPLTCLPQSIANLSNLRVLEVHDTGTLSTVPEGICNLHNLRSLALADDTSLNGSLITLPENLGNLKKLRKLQLFGNKLTELPQSLSKCDKLKTVEIQENQFSKLPSFLSSWQNLESIEFSFNPIGSISYEHFQFLSQLKQFSKLRPILSAREKAIIFKDFIFQFEITINETNAIIEDRNKYLSMTSASTGISILQFRLSHCQDIQTHIIPSLYGESITPSEYGALVQHIGIVEQYLNNLPLLSNLLAIIKDILNAQFDEDKFIQIVTELIYAQKWEYIRILIQYCKDAYTLHLNKQLQENITRIIHGPIANTDKSLVTIGVEQALVDPEHTLLIEYLLQLGANKHYILNMLLDSKSPNALTVWQRLLIQ